MRPTRGKVGEWDWSQVSLGFPEPWKYSRQVFRWEWSGLTWEYAHAGLGLRAQRHPWVTLEKPLTNLCSPFSHLSKVGRWGGRGVGGWEGRAGLLRRALHLFFSLC